MTLSTTTTTTASLRVSPLGSGSSGNATLVRYGGRAILIDCGLGPRTLRTRLLQVNADLRSIEAVIVTHGHGDHTGAIPKIAGPCSWQIHASQACASHQSYRFRNLIVRPFVIGESFEVAGIQVTSFATVHDAPGSVGFVLRTEESSFAYCTDLGRSSPTVASAMRGCDAVMLEFNHDREMLQAGPYSPRLKRRIASDHGHLSNAQSAALLAEITKSNLKSVLLAHLSEKNNSPQLATDAAKLALITVEHDDVDVRVALAHEATGTLNVRDGSWTGPTIDVRHQKQSKNSEMAPKTGVPTAASAVESGLSSRAKRAQYDLFS